MENKYLQLRRDNIFTKFINFFRKVFYKELSTKEENINIVAKNSPKDFLNEIKLQYAEDKKMLELQEKYERREVKLASMSDEEIHNLNLLYKRQIEDLKKKLDNKKTELNIMKNRIKNIESSFTN